MLLCFLYLRLYLYYYVFFNAYFIYFIIIMFFNALCLRGVRRYSPHSVKACRVAALSDIAERVKRFRLVFACVPFLV